MTVDKRDIHLKEQKLESQSINGCASMLWPKPYRLVLSDLGYDIGYTLNESPYSFSFQFFFPPYNSGKR